MSMNNGLVILTAIPFLIMGGTTAHDWYYCRQPGAIATTGTSRRSSPYRSRCRRRDG